MFNNIGNIIVYVLPSPINVMQNSYKTVLAKAIGIFLHRL